MALSVWTDQQVIDQLGSTNTFTGPAITYSFALNTSQIYSLNWESFSFYSMPTYGWAKTSAMLELWDDVIATDIESGSPGSTNIAIGMSTNMVVNNYYSAYKVNQTGSIWLHADYGSDKGGNSLTDPTVGTRGYHYINFCIGTVLGEALMSPENGSPTGWQDSTLYSVMSYWGPQFGANSAHAGDVAWGDWTGADGVTYWAQTPMMNDILALQSMYGADTNTRSGDTVYGFNSTITDSSAMVYDFAQNAHPVLCIYDAGGTDTLDLSGFSSASRIDLAPGSFSDCADMTNNVSIARDVTIENAAGGAGDDTISGNSAANDLSGRDGADTIDGKGGDDTLTGGAGNDTLTGGSGNDTAMFSADWSGLQVVYNPMTGVMTVTSTADGTDTLSGVERLIDGQGVIKMASSFAPAPAPVFSVAADAASVTEGNSGTTPYSFTVSLAAASAQNQTIGWRLAFASGSGQAAASDFSGATSGTVTVEAGATSKTLTMSVAGDTAVESDEAFTLQLYRVNTGVTVASASGLITNDDTASSSPLKLTGNSLANTLIGGAGDDNLSGLIGNDTLSGMGGNDLLLGGIGWDRLTGGTGADRFDFDTYGQTSQVSSTGTVLNTDVITDFEAGTDKIDLSTIDASVRQLLNNAFTWLGTDPIGKLLAGELRYQQYDNAGTDNDYTMVLGDIDADVLPEFAIKLTGLVTLSASDFVL